VLLQPFVVSVAHRVPRARMLALGALVTGLGFGLTGLASAPLVYGLSIVVWTVGEIALSAVAPAVIADYAPPHLRGSYQGTYQLSWGVASFLGPITGSYVLGHFGGGVLWAGCLAVGVTGGAATPVRVGEPAPVTGVGTPTPQLCNRLISAAEELART